MKITSAIPKTRLTPEEYLEFERRSEIKHEYFNGEIFAMSGAKWKHNVIAWNIGGEPRQKLKDKKCSVCPGDKRVFVPETGLYT